MADGESMWGEMLDVLKDISNYLEKQDAVQEEADIDKPPKIKEHQKEIVGGNDPSGAPGKGIVKEYVDIPDAKGPNAKESIDASEKTQLKKAEKESDEDEDEDSKKEEEDSEESSDDVEELKSLLKDIKSALLTKSVDTKEVSDLIGTEVKKALPNAMEKMLRKMGYNMSKPDIVKMDTSNYGLDEDTIKKSSDEKSSEDLNKKAEDINKTVNDLSKKSWGELGQLREKTGAFNIFPRP